MNTNPIVPNYAVTIVYNALITLHWVNRIKGLRKLWEGIWKWSIRKYSVPVKTIIHNHKVIVNNGYTYPLTTRRFDTFNNPLIELTFQSYQMKQRPINLIDIGAAVGDTVLLLYENCPNMLGGITCIDGDKEFFSYLEHNLEGINNICKINTMLSSDIGVERDLLRIHSGTASSQSESYLEATTIDCLFMEKKFHEIDLIKIDLDGLDGKVLQGGRTLLSKYFPAVIFEWHPILYKKTGNDWLVPFEVLTSENYDRFIWFDKFGNFCQFSGYDRKSINAFAKLCLNNQYETDWHYDIVGLHRYSQISETQLAELSFARKKKSQY